ncbi:MAG: uracil-DNA glycosylase [Gemmatimonadota bacterium]
MVRCTRCDLFMSRAQVVPGSGPSSPRVLLVGEAPGATEDREGVPFVGRSGALLESMLAVAGLSRDAVFIANVVRCRPPKNRNPRTAEMRACAGWLAAQIRILDPPIIVTLGRCALQRFIPEGKITQLQAELQQVTVEGRTLPLYPLLHPSAVLRNPTLRQSYEDQFGKLGGLIGG